MFQNLKPNPLYKNLVWLSMYFISICKQTNSVTNIVILHYKKLTYLPKFCIFVFFCFCFLVCGCFRLYCFYWELVKSRVKSCGFLHPLFHKLNGAVCTSLSSKMPIVPASKIQGQGFSANTEPNISTIQNFNLFSESPQSHPNGPSQKPLLCCFGGRKQHSSYISFAS